MLGVLIGIGFVFLFLIPIFMIVASGVIIYGWRKAAKKRKEEERANALSKKVGLV